MFGDELIVGHIIIERPYQVVAVSPRMRNDRIAFTAMRICITQPVHPVAGPLFSETLIFQQGIDQLFDRPVRVAIPDLKK